ncbi:serine hydrolase domain-containing protein [Clostridium sp. MCC353]|uniref:serine hydrolase domain-containing protein n=1 Tax=Clostridium sp. MCC353 TaxID=2592646 RepID=UPI001C035ED6|nr:serine hydrolase domain-containing protein [Clostridium sp. MCC353]
MEELVFGSPKESGVPSGAVLSCLKRLAEQNVPLHSLLLYRKGKVITEAYSFPYEKHSLHRMYSITKSFTSLAVGLLADKGLIGLDDPVIKYFEEYLPQTVHPWLASMTIRDMLEMKTCHEGTTYKKDLTKNWVESFFITEPDHRPGTIFSYDTSSAHTLCALVEKLTGMELLEFLKGECLNEIGFSAESYVKKDPFGVSIGGSGLMATPMDLLKTGILLLRQGEYGGRQIYPKWYLEEAVKCQTQTAGSRNCEDERQGYGYQFWQFRHGCFGCYGMGGQFVLCCPQQELVCVTTADTLAVTGGHQQVLDAVFDCIFPYLDMEEDGKEGELEEYLARLSMPPVENKKIPASAWEKAEGLYESVKEGGYFKNMGFSFSEDKSRGRLRYSCEQGEGVLEFGMGVWVCSEFPFYGQSYAASGGWTEDGDLMIKIQITGEDSSSVSIQAAFFEGGLTAFMKSTGENVFLEFSGFFEGKVKS